MTPPAVITVPRKRVVIGWITQAGWDVTQETGYPLLPGPEIVDFPDQAVFITMAGGAGYATEEGGADTWTFQARVRGAADDPDGPEAAAQLLDYLILHGPQRTSVNGVPVLNVQRLSSPPAALPLDPASRRFEYTATYAITTGGG